MFAVVTPNTGTVAETFIRQHIRQIAPGKTVVVCFRDDEKFADSVHVIKLSLQRRERLPWILKKYNGILFSKQLINYI